MIIVSSQARRPRRWMRLGAACLVALLALLALHAFAPHDAAMRDCTACQALRTQAPGVVLAGPALIEPQVTHLGHERVERLVSRPICRLAALRAPPQA